MFLFRFGSFLIKINSISGFFILGTLDYDNRHECFQMKGVTEFFLEIAHYSIVVSILSFFVGIVLLLVNILILAALFDALLGSIFFCNLDCCRFVKICFYLIFFCALFFALLVLTNIVFYFILHFGNEEARIINVLMTINFVKTLASKFSNCFNCCSSCYCEDNNC